MKIPRTEKTKYLIFFNSMEQIVHLTQLGNKKMINISRRHGQTLQKRIYVNGQ